MRSHSLRKLVDRSARPAFQLRMIEFPVVMRITLRLNTIRAVSAIEFEHWFA